MRTLLIIVAFASLTAASPAAFAQGVRPIVGTAPFFRPHTVSPETAAQLQAMVGNMLFESNRFDLVEVEQLDALDAEIYEQGAEQYMDGIVTAVAPMGAEYLLFGTIAGADVSSSHADGVQTFSARVTYELRKVSVGTRQVECQARVQTNVGSKLKSAGRDALTRFARRRVGQGAARAASSTLNADTPEAALIAAINDTQPQVETFLATCFTTAFEVLAVEQEGEGGRVEEVLISAGEEWGLSAGDGLHVVEQQRFELRDGTVKTRDVPVASLTVKEVQGEGFSVCTVHEGQDKLRDALEEDALLVVKKNE